MPKTIDKLYDFLRQASESEPPSPEYRKISSDVIDVETSLHKTFSDEQSELYEQLCYERYRQDSLDAYSDFSQGFVWGGRLMLELLSR